MPGFRQSSDFIPLHNMSSSSHSRSSSGTVDDDDEEDLMVIDPSDRAPLIDGQNPAPISTGKDSRPFNARERYVTMETALPRNKHYNFASNAISNAKYTPVSFIPVILFEDSSSFSTYIFY